MAPTGTSAAPSKALAGVHGSRTHPSARLRRGDRFEDGEDHRALSTPRPHRTAAALRYEPPSGRGVASGGRACGAGGPGVSVTTGGGSASSPLSSAGLRKPCSGRSSRVGSGVGVAVGSAVGVAVRVGAAVGGGAARPAGGPPAPAAATAEFPLLASSEACLAVGELTTSVPGSSRAIPGSTRLNCGGRFGRARRPMEPAWASPCGDWRTRMRPAPAERTPRPGARAAEAPARGPVAHGKRNCSVISALGPIVAADTVAFSLLSVARCPTPLRCSPDIRKHAVGEEPGWLARVSPEEFDHEHLAAELLISPDLIADALRAA